ncbi:unnamed protein product [Prunus armeniaca]
MVAVEAGSNGKVGHREPNSLSLVGVSIPPWTSPRNPKEFGKFELFGLGFVKVMDEFWRTEEGEHVGKLKRLRRSGVGGYAPLAPSCNCCCI